MSYLCGVGSYICGFPTPKEQTVNRLNAIPKEITKQEIFAAFGATADSKKDINFKTSDLKDPYGLKF